jgi:hypothetical protein
MFIEQLRWIWRKWLRREVERVWRNDQLRWSLGNRWILCIRGKHRHGRKRLGRPALDGRCYRLGWIDGNGWRNGWNDSRAIRRRERLRRKVGVWWERR